MSDKLIPVFKIKPQGPTNAIIKYKGLINEGDKLIDDIVELDKCNNNTISVELINKYTITGHIYKCNIIGSHIVLSTKYPVIYIDIRYEKPMVSGSLFQLMYTIVIDPIDKKKITDYKQYIDLQFCGSWIRHIECDIELQKNYDTLINEMLEKDAIELFYDNSNIELQNKFKSDDEIMEWISTYTTKEKKEYDLLLKPIQINFKSINKIKDELIELCTSMRFHKFIKIALLCRDENRRCKYGVKKETYDKPNITLYIDKLKQNLIDNDELIKKN